MVIAVECKHRWIIQSLEESGESESLFSYCKICKATKEHPKEADSLYNSWRGSGFNYTIIESESKTRKINSSGEYIN